MNNCSCEDTTTRFYEEHGCCEWCYYVGEEDTTGCRTVHMNFTEEDKERITKQVVSQWVKAHGRGELSAYYQLYAVRFDQSDYTEMYTSPNIALIYRERTDEYGRTDPDGEWYYMIAWGAVSKSRDKWVFHKNDYICWSEAGGVAWEGRRDEYDKLIEETTVSHPEWEYVMVAED